MPYFPVLSGVRYKQWIIWKNIIAPKKAAIEMKLQVKEKAEPEEFTVEDECFAMSRPRYYLFCFLIIARCD